MREFVCSFFGHRKISVTEELKVKVKETIKNLINSSNVLTKQVSLYEINLNYGDIDE